MSKGTPSMGKKAHTKSHGSVCRRCNNHAWHYQKQRCASCGYPSAKIRSFNWALKASRRRTTGTGRMQHLKKVQRAFKNGFRTGVAKPKKSATA